MGWRTDNLRALSGPNLLSYSATGFLGPGFARLHLSGGKRRLLEAILVALSRDRLAWGLLEVYPAPRRVQNFRRNSTF
jgi:hypothetical protein